MNSLLPEWTVRFIVLKGTNLYQSSAEKIQKEVFLIRALIQSIIAKKNRNAIYFIDIRNLWL